MSLKKELFKLLHENLVATFPSYASKEVVLCPVCFTEITENEVLGGALEHIVPTNIVNEDPDCIKFATKNQRSGLTVLCRKRRIWGNQTTYDFGERDWNIQIKWSNKVANQGCNGLKGSLYDRVFCGLLDDTSHNLLELTNRQKVATLMMGYLGAFQIFGYEYVLLPELNEVRDQFDRPDIKITKWLDRVVYFADISFPGICATEWGMPFNFGGSLHESAPLEVRFRRFRVELPPGHSLVRHPPKTLSSSR